MPILVKVAGYTIQFPNTLAELEKEYPNGHRVDYNKFIDSNQTNRVEWQFNVWGSNRNHDPRNNPYGIVIYLKNKGDRLDSVKTALEQQYNQVLQPFIFQKLQGDFTKIDPPIYTCHIERGTILVLTKAVSYRRDSWSQYNSLRVSIGYNLTKKEEELFALTSGSIHEDAD